MEAEILEQDITNGDTVEENEDAAVENLVEKSLTADNTIKNFLLGSMGVGLIPYPVVDLVSITALQMGMLKKLSKIYNTEFSKDIGKSIIGSLVGSVSPLLFLGPAASLIKWLPIVGQAVGVVTMPVVAGASTYALGKVFKKHFELGGTLLNFDAERMKKSYKEKFEEGKKKARKLKNSVAGQKA